MTIIIFEEKSDITYETIREQLFLYT